MGGLFLIYGLSIPFISMVSLLSIYVYLVIYQNYRFEQKKAIILFIYLFSSFFFCFSYLYYGEMQLKSFITNFLILSLPGLISILDFETKKAEKVLLGFTLISSLGFFAFSVLVVGYNFFNPELIDLSGRIFINFYNASSINAPVLGLYLIPFLVYYSFYALQVRGSFNVFLLVIVILIYLFCCIVLQNRSGFLIFGLILPYYIKKFNFKYLFTFFMFGITLFIFVMKNDNFTLAFEHILHRFSTAGMNSSRYELWYEGLHMMISNPFGGFYSTSTGASAFHNTWLDIAKAAGIFPLLGYICVNLYAFLNAFSFDPKNRNIVFYILLLMNAGVFFEPVFKATPWIFSCMFGSFLLVNTFISILNKHELIAQEK